MVVVGTATALVASFMIANGSSASLAEGPFEIEGNLVVDGGTGSLDWANAAIQAAVVCEDNPATQSVEKVVGCGLDKPTGQTDDSFGNGTKEDSAVPSVTDGSIPNNKSDLTRFYATSNKANIGGATKDMLYLAWERVQDPSGTTNMDFEFNQGTSSTNGVTKDRKGGDVLIKFDLSQGGVNPSFGIHRWQDGTAPWNKACEASSRFPCWGQVKSIPLNSVDLATGAVNNSGSVIDPIAPIPAGQTSRSLSIRTFGEAAINLTDTEVLGEDCATFGSAYLKSRSSDSFTAAVKDFIAPVPVEVSNCGSIKLTKTFSAGAPTTPAIFVLYKNVAPLAAPHGAGDTLVVPVASTKLTVAAASGATSMTVADGTKVPAAPFYAKVDSEIVKVTAKAGDVLTVERAKLSTSAGAHAIDAGLSVISCTYSTSGADCTFGGLKLGEYILSEIETPTGYQTAADRAVTVATVSPATEVTIANSPAPKDITVGKRDGSGGPVKICTTLTPGITSDCAAFTLSTLGASGTLASPAVDASTDTFTFASTAAFPAVPFTALVGKEIVSVTGKSATTLSVTRAQSGTTAVGHAVGDAVEEVKSTPAPKICTPADYSAAVLGNCTFASVEPGSYVIVETTHPSGRGKDSDLPERIVVALTDTSPILRTYDNPPLYKVITVVCSLAGTPSLKPSKLAYDAEIASGASPVTPATGSLAGSGITDAEICGLTGNYVLNNTAPGPHKANIDIP